MKKSCYPKIESMIFIKIQFKLFLKFQEFLDGLVNAFLVW
jgi:hypothetical protein